MSSIWTTYKEVESFMLESKENVDSAIESFRDKQVRETKDSIVGFLEGINIRLDQTITEFKEDNFNDYAENTNVEAEEDAETMLVELLEGISN